jgi:hypothetical protein
MEVQKDIGQHHHHPVAPIARRGVTEDAFPNLGVSNKIADAHFNRLSALLTL